MARTGRRPGQAKSRDAIIEAARAAFSEEGYDAATIRGIARRAGVDPALVHHFFGTKRLLFVETMQLPFDPEALIRMVLSGDPATVGERIARTFFSVWESDAAAPFIALVRSAASHDDAARMLREVIGSEVLGRIADELGTPDGKLRASLVGTQIIGMIMARYIIKIEPLASTEPELLVPALAGTLQRYLTGDIGPKGVT